MSSFSKGEGSKIGVQFSEELVGDYATPTEGYPELPINNSNIMNITYSNQYSGTYSASNAFDNSTSSYWRTDVLPVWVQIQLPTPIAMTKFRWYIGNSTYYPTSFIIEGSNDGENYTEVYSGVSTSGTGWKEFTIFNTQSFLYYRWTITGRNSSRIYIYEIEVFYKQFKNEGAFNLSGKQYKFINGDLIDSIYTVISVEPHPIEEKSILLTLSPYSRFPTVEGDLTITYDASKGNLAGAGGAVESFTRTFTPTDLVPEPNPHVVENITAQPYIDLVFTEVTYHSSFVKESITASPASVTAELIHTSIINP